MRGLSPRADRTREWRDHDPRRSVRYRARGNPRETGDGAVRDHPQKVVLLRFSMEWDPEAKVAKMKDGRTHLAHKAEHAVDLETGAMIAVMLQGADAGDTTTIIETALAAAEQIEDAQADVTEPADVR